MFGTHLKLIILDHTIVYLTEDTTSFTKTKYANNSKFVTFMTLIKLIISITNDLHLVMLMVCRVLTTGQQLPNPKEAVADLLRCLVGVLLLSP